MNTRTTQLNTAIGPVLLEVLASRVVDYVGMLPPLQFRAHIRAFEWNQRGFAFFRSCHPCHVIPTKKYLSEKCDLIDLRVVFSLLRIRNMPQSSSGSIIAAKPLLQSQVLSFVWFH